MTPYIILFNFSQGFSEAAALNSRPARYRPVSYTHLSIFVLNHFRKQYIVAVKCVKKILSLKRKNLLISYSPDLSSGYFRCYQNLNALLSSVTQMLRESFSQQWRLLSFHFIRTFSLSHIFFLLSILNVPFSVWAFIIQLFPL